MAGPRIQPLAAVTRGPLTESVHAGSLVIADTSGRVVWQAGGVTDEPVYYRSAMKPVQAIPFVLSGAAEACGCGERGIALACASHSGEPEHVRVVQAMLAAGGLAPRCLKCGAHPPYAPRAAAALLRKGRRPAALHHNCSGKHAAMLLVCRRKGWPLGSYLEPAHPLQREIKALVAEFAGLPVSKVVSSRDGCNLPAHAVSLRRMAMTYARLAAPEFWRARGRPELADAVQRITRAMRAHPFLVSGTGRGDLALMGAAADRRGGRLFSKMGAEAVWCAGFPEAGLGLALKVADGANRASPAIMAEALRQSGLLGPAAIRRFLASMPTAVTSGDGTRVGAIRAVFRLVPSKRP